MSHKNQDNALDEKPFWKKFDYMFRERKLLMSQTTMCWGLCVGKGWKQLLWELCTKLQRELDKRGNESLKMNFAVHQVKEKYGTLRFYVNGYTNKIMDALINNAEDMSFITCEVCGNLGKLSSKGNWRAVRCKICAKKEGYKEIKNGHK